MATYAEKLKDPLWQKKRLKVLERDEWTCQWCGKTEDTLHVHHIKYAKSGNPWDSKLEDMETLCESCHGENYAIEQEMKEQIRYINKYLRSFHPGDLSTIELCCKIIAKRKPIAFWDLISRINACV